MVHIYIWQLADNHIWVLYFSNYVFWWNSSLQNTKQGEDGEQAQTQRQPISQSDPSQEDYQQIQDTHAREVNELQQKNDLQKKRQRQELLDKLAERRTKRENRVSSNFVLFTTL